MCERFTHVLKKIIFLIEINTTKLVYWYKFIENY